MDYPSVALDFGSHSSKVGMIGYDGPSVIFPTQVNKFYDKEYYVGEEKEECHFYSFPISNKKVTNWDDFERICVYAFNLDVNTEEFPILLTESPLNSKESRRKSTEIMFEKFNVPLFYMENQCALSLLCYGTVNGFMLDIGEQVTHLAPIYEGTTLKYATIEAEIGGVNLTNRLKRLLSESYTKQFTVQDISNMKKLCHVEMDYESALLNSGWDQSLEKSYELPDGSMITLKTEIFKTGELFFERHPYRPFKGIHEMIEKSISNLNLEFWNCTNIGFSGGSNIDGLADRFLKESRQLDLPFKLELFDHHNCVKENVNAWIGASMLGSILPINRWVSNQEYNETGPDIVRKCF